jgi:protein-tyrosine phosphatase
VRWEASRCRHAGEGRRPASPDGADTRGYVDLHSHVLPGLDDGAATIEESLELARALAASGVGVLAATPHCSERYPTTARQLDAGLAAVRLALRQAGIPLELVAGAEIALDRVRGLDDETLEAFTLGGAGRYVLLEFPYDGWPVGLPRQLAELAAAGIGAVLAHPERNREVQLAPQRLAGLVDEGALVQVNAGSFLRARAGQVATVAWSLLESGLVHVLASDSHRPGSRPTLADAADSLPGEVFECLARDAPAAILAGKRPPALPPVPPRKRRRLPFTRR